jgi:hypothetical protein
VIRRLLVLCVCVAALAGCRVDLSVDMTVEPDGTGTITLVATADAEVVAAVPTLADELATDDIVAAGWAIDGPTALPDGGLTITLSHDFSSDEEATNLLDSLGPPFNQMSVTRNTSGDDTTTRLAGLLGLPDGFESYADEDLVAAVGSVPFADRIAASGATPESSMSAVIRAQLPGDIDGDETNGTRLDDNRLEWIVPMDGTILDWRAVSVQSPGDGRWWARPLSIVALVALVAWVAFMTLFIGYVVWARWQRTRRRRRPARPAR